MTSRRWCFTYFAPSEDELSCFDSFIRKLRGSSYYKAGCWQVEEAPETGKIHLQGYVELTQPVRRTSLQTIDRKAHWEAAKGSRAQCVQYCQKEETRALGEFPDARYCDPLLREKSTQGRRSDLIDIASNIANGTLSRNDLFSTRPDVVLKFSRGVNELFRHAEQRTGSVQRDVRVTVLYGHAGSGKTRYAYQSCDDVFILENSNGDNVWWDGYRGESTLIIDDFYGWIKHNLLLRLLDRYPCRLEVKGGSTYAKWTNVFITSNQPPELWYKKFPWESDMALQRRITEIWFCVLDKNDDNIPYKWREEKTGRTMNFDKNFILFK